MCCPWKKATRKIRCDDLKFSQIKRKHTSGSYTAGHHQNALCKTASLTCWNFLAQGCLLQEVQHKLNQGGHKRQQLDLVRTANLEKMLENLGEKELRLQCLTEEAEKSSKQRQLQEKKVKKEMQQVSLYIGHFQPYSSVAHWEGVKIVEEHHLLRLRSIRLESHILQWPYKYMTFPQTPAAHQYAST